MQCLTVAVKVPSWINNCWMSYKILGRIITITVKNLNGQAAELTRVVEGLKVANEGRETYQKERWVTLRKTYVRKDLAVEIDAVKPSQIAKWKYLEQIKGELNLNPNVKLGSSLGQIVHGHWNQGW